MTDRAASPQLHEREPHGSGGSSGDDAPLSLSSPAAVSSPAAARSPAARCDAPASDEPVGVAPAPEEGATAAKVR
jgi:hypothetical protein